MEAQFPRIWAHLKVESINTHGRLITWPAAFNQSAQADAEALPQQEKPLVLMAHLDTVPVEPSTMDQWTHPPWSGHFNATEDWLYGRGACDCKSIAWAQLQAVELLLEGGFAPRREIILALGFDEESSGLNGAGEIAKVLRQRYGSDGVYAIWDEGSGNQDLFGVEVAGVGTGEKGYDDMLVTVNTPGGHSSIPPRHTSIGILGQIITAVEASTDAFEPSLQDHSPFYQHLQCLAQHAPDMPSSLRQLIQQSSTSKDRSKLIAYLQETDLMGEEAKWLMQTSQAITLAQGGIKTNALPEAASISINYRIDIESDVNAVEKHVEQVLSPIAQRFNLSLNAFDHSTAEKSSRGSIKTQSIGPLEPAPLTPTGWLETPWHALSGSIRHALGTHLIVSPYMSTGNTDTASYWRFGRNLTRHIFRYASQQCESMHTVDEKVKIQSHLRAIWLNHELIRNVAA